MSGQGLKHTVNFKHAASVQLLHLRGTTGCEGCAVLHSETESTCNSLLKGPSQRVKRKQTTEEINFFNDQRSSSWFWGGSSSRSQQSKEESGLETLESGLETLQSGLETLQSGPANAQQQGHTLLSWRRQRDRRSKDRVVSRCSDVIAALRWVLARRLEAGKDGNAENV